MQAARRAMAPRAAGNDNEDGMMSDKPLTDVVFSSFDLHPALLAGLEDEFDVFVGHKEAEPAPEIWTAR